MMRGMSAFSSVARPEIAAVLPPSYSDVLAGGQSKWPTSTGSSLPILYSSRYNITFLGLEKVGMLHNFSRIRLRQICQSKGGALEGGSDRCGT